MGIILAIAKYVFLALLLAFVCAIYRAILSEMRRDEAPSAETREAPATAERPAARVLEAAATPEPQPSEVPDVVAQPPPLVPPLPSAEPMAAAPAPAELDATVEGPRLVVIKSPDPDRLPPGKVFPLMDRTYLGRATDSPLPLPDRFASLTHAGVILRDGGYVLKDMGSTNGTFLNGVRLSSEAPLTEGDQIEIGTTLLMYRR